MNILITGAWKEAKQNIPAIEKTGHTVCFLQQEKDTLPCAYSWVEGVICNGLFLHHSIEKFENLKYIQLTSAGFDRVDMDYVHAKGIEIHNARGVYSVPMAEFALCGVLQLYKQVNFFTNNQTKKTWQKYRNLKELFDKSVLIVGCGSVGNACAERFKAFGCNVTGIDLFPRTDVLYQQIFSLAALDYELSKADIIILTVPLTEQTKHLINQERLQRLKSEAVLVNIARGAIIDTQALLEKAEDIGGAVLDVFEEEPLDENSPLWKKENIIITPHNSFESENNAKRLFEVIMSNLGGKH